MSFYRLTISLILISLHGIVQAQHKGVKDSIKHNKDTVFSMNTLIIETDRIKQTHLNQLEGTAIYAGKKSEVILLSNTAGNTATNNARQIYNKIAGLNIWESDGAGMQLGIGGRGLNPNRVSNFNTRQNGYDISADALGYPESYYSPPTEALERIEVVRGAASLQYGTQFGGFINFKFKQPPPDKVFQIEARQTIASFGFYNAYTSIAGTKNKFSYFAFHQYKRGDGWRKNSEFNVHTAHASVSYKFTSKIKLTAEYTFMDYLTHQAGGLTDNQFKTNPRESYRSRNWFKVNWNLAALNLDYNISSNARLNFRMFGLYAQRDALGFLGFINRTDPMQERDLLQDKFRNTGAELRYVYRYKLHNQISTLLVGSRLYKGFTFRKQGYGSKGSDADFNYLNPGDLEHSDYKFPSGNTAVFAENIFKLSPRMTVTPGLRMEHISTQSIGYYNEQYTDLAGNIIYKNKVEDNRNSKRNFLLAGLGISYKITPTIETYANFSQNYRSINFNDMRIVNPNSRVDNNLKDETGFSTDWGIRGNLKKNITFDISAFYLRYNNRIGAIFLVDSFTYQPYRYRTNISDSRNIGIESLVEVDAMGLLFKKKHKLGITVFGNFSFIDARYTDSKQAAFTNKKVEFVPKTILRTGISFSYQTFKLTYQFAHTGDQFTDASNTVYSANAVTGLIPAYTVMDLAISYQYKKISLATGINNLSNNMYFTRRADGYPGPGIIPSDGRSVYLTLGVKI
ncbi:MAG: TonB-dependent receptor [Bacteroidota bacterium]